ncbi:hydrogenase maturation nickel metallochaperone HypA [Nitrosophilus kaiyonis]|uniref:hydrogenase maturation nickel metallochaperone HypA n=1 Tax=Nitrosophilus kaiyonis TaxID=2930200 RepID=UPI0024925A22|nr:hydrogenase maturation nickel metallochaperone HypA [Nitrosophilus kaiyonis]
MHEYSIVQSLLDIIEDNVKKNRGKKVIKVVVKIGVLSGVEPYLLESAFNTFKKGTVCEEATFEMIIDPLKVKCKECNSINELDHKSLIFECTNCKGVDLEVLSGEDMYLMRIEME